MSENSAGGTALQGGELMLLGGDIQQRIADIADVIFKMDGERLCDRICDEIAFGASRLEAAKLPETAGIEGKIARGRLIDRIKKTERETEEIMDSLKGRQTELYKAEAAYLCLREQLEKHRGELSEIRKKYEGSVTARRMSELEMSEAVADRYIKMTDDRRNAVKALSEGISSLVGNAYPLWRGAVASTLDRPVTENLSRAESIRQAIVSEIKELANG